MPTAQQNQACGFIRKIEKYPNLTINPCFEMVYKDVLQHGANIIQLFLNHVSADQRVILPGQDLFENIAAFNERLLYMAGETPQRPGQSTSRKPHERLKYLPSYRSSVKCKMGYSDSPVAHHTRLHGYQQKPKWY